MNTEVGKKDVLYVISASNRLVLKKLWILLPVLLIGYPTAFLLSAIFMPYLEFGVLVAVRSFIIALPLIYVSIETVKHMGIKNGFFNAALVAFLQAYFAVIASLPIIIF